MDIQTLTRFFMWCTILNGGMLIVTALMLMLAPDLIYRIQSKWFAISRDTFNKVCYGFMGLYKVFIVIFNLVPYVALLIIG